LFFPYGERRTFNLPPSKKGFCLLYKTRFLFLLGPTCVGKGFIIKLISRLFACLQAMGLRVGLISFGQIIRDLMDSDPEFRAKYGDVVRNGDLIEDPKAIELFEAKLAELCREGCYHLIIVDGFCRTTVQIRYAIENGYLQAKDRVYIIEGSFETCLKRFTHRKGRDTTRTETEISTFTKRYHLHSDSVNDLMALFQSTEAKTVSIDGNPDIAEFVFPALMQEVLPLAIKAVKVEEQAEEQRVA
jgi:adenylate kinase family enzyme